VRRGELYLVKKPGRSDPKRQRVFVLASRNALIGTRHSSVICAPVYSHRYGLSTEVEVGVEEGLKRESSIHCDALVSLPKALLTDYVGSLGPEKLAQFDRALMTALDLDYRGASFGP